MPPALANDVLLPVAPTSALASLRTVRAYDRAVLEVAREIGLRPMELYALLLLRAAREPLPTSRLAEHLAASRSQAKQLALRLSARGLAMRHGAHGRTELTGRGRELADRAGQLLERRLGERLAVTSAL